jgi:hypothetical protein
LLLPLFIDLHLKIDAFASTAELYPENQYTGHLVYELSNLNSGCANAAGILILVKWKVDYWKSEFSLEMPVPSQGHYGFHSFPVVD